MLTDYRKAHPEQTQEIREDEAYLRSQKATPNEAELEQIRMQYLYGNPAGHPLKRGAAGADHPETDPQDVAGNGGTTTESGGRNNHPAHERGNGGLDCVECRQDEDVG